MSLIDVEPLRYVAPAGCPARGKIAQSSKAEKQEIVGHWQIEHRITRLADSNHMRGMLFEPSALAYPLLVESGTDRNQA
jgi:hypothetical protein